METKRILVINASLGRFRQKFPEEFEKFDMEGIDLVKEPFLFDPSSEWYLPKLRDVVILGVGYEFWTSVRNLHKSREIHIGLRYFTYNDIIEMPCLTINKTVQISVSNGAEFEDKIPLFFANEVPYGSKMLLPEQEIVELDNIQHCLDRLEREETGFKGFDFESKGFPLRKGTRPLGLSIVGQHYGFYVHMRDNWDFNSEPYVPLKAYILKHYKELVVYNVSFEAQMVYQMWQVFLPFADAYAAGICDDFKRSLKVAAQKYLSVPSWDDDLEGEQHALDMVFKYYNSYEHFNKGITNNKKGPEAKAEFMGILKENLKSEKDPKDYITRYKKRLGEDWGSSWACVEPDILGKYCVYDSFYTLKVWDVLAPLYPRALPVYHHNMYLKASLGMTGIHINREKVNFLRNYYDNITNNSRIFMNRYYMDELESLYGEYLDTLDIPKELEPLILVNPKWIVLEPVKVIKEILLSNLNENDIITWKGVKDLLGSDIAKELASHSELVILPADSWKRKKSLFRNASVMFTNKFRTLSLVRQINQEQLSKCKSKIAELRAEVEEIAKAQGFNPNKLQKVAWEMEYNKKYSINDHPGDLKEWRYVNNFRKAENWEANSKLLGYIRLDWIKDWLVSYNFKTSIPRLQYYEFPQDIVTVEEICTLIKLRHRKVEYDKLDNMRIYDDFPVGDISVDTLANEVKNWNSDKDSLLFTENFIKDNMEIIAGLTRYYDYMWSKGFKEEPGQLEAIIKAYPSTARFQADKKMFMSWTNLENKGFLQAAKMSTIFSALFGFGTQEIRRQYCDFVMTNDSTLKRPETKMERIQQGCIVWNLFKAALKQLSPYINLMTDNAKAIDKTIGNAQILDDGVAGDEYIAPFKANTANTKRWQGVF